jgi:hypothetical protein
VTDGGEETTDVARTGSASSLRTAALLAALVMMAACGGGTSKTSDAGRAGADSGADGRDTSASNRPDASLDANSSDAGDASKTPDSKDASDAAGDASRTCLPDGGTSADPLEGTWVDTSSAEQWTVSNVAVARYDYDFGSGASSSSVTKLDDVPRDVCPADASAGN